MKKLTYDQALLDDVNILHTAGDLKEKSEPILWQFPTSLKWTFSNLRNFVPFLVTIFSMYLNSAMSHGLHKRCMMFWKNTDIACALYRPLERFLK